MLRITVIGTGALVLSAWCLGVLNSHRKFFLSYVAPVLWNIAQIVVLAFVFIGSWEISDAATAAAWGMVAGGFLQFGVQIAGVWKVAPDLRPNFKNSLPAVIDIRKRFFPAVMGRGVVQISAYVDLFLASLLTTGAVAALLSAQVLYLLPISLFVMSVAASDKIRLSEFTSIPLDLISSISSNKAHGSTTTPFPITEILFFLTIPEGNSLNL